LNDLSRPDPKANGEPGLRADFDPFFRARLRRKFTLSFPRPTGSQERGRDQHKKAQHPASVSRSGAVLDQEENPINE
jgi:hypothetical protein